jgi:acyl transferase domain-containing protein
VLREALRRTDSCPGQVQYVEAHASGMLLGDTIEAAALGAVLAKDRLPGIRCAVGSVKTNFGHLESAAGIAGLIKVALMLRHQMIPPSLHFTKPNLYIDFTKLPLRVPTMLEPWPDDQSPALAGVSAFGALAGNSTKVSRLFMNHWTSAWLREIPTSAVPLPICLRAQNRASPKVKRSLANPTFSLCNTH